MNAFPFEPRPMQDLKGRITKAIQKAGHEDTIGPANVFDTLDGLRLIIWSLQAGRSEHLRILVQTDPARFVREDERDDLLVRAAQLYWYLKPNEWPSKVHVSACSVDVEAGRFTAVLRTGRPSLKNALQQARNGANDGSKSVANAGGQREGS